MNLVYRTIWSESHGGFVVAHEKAAAGGKPSTTRSAIAQAVVAALLAVGTAEAGAIPVCSAAVTLAGNYNNSGTLDATGNCNGLQENAGTVSGSVTNSGTISGANSMGISIQGTLDGAITNSGTISAGRDGFFAAGTLTGSITNSGTISGSVRNGLTLNAGTIGGSIVNNGGAIIGVADGITMWNQSAITGGIVNGGNISGGNHGIYASWGAVIGGINNRGTISGGNTGILVSSTGNLTGGITNSGTIRGGSSGAGIYLSRHSTVSGGITNSGTISGGNTGIAVSTGSTITGGLTNSGTISGGTRAIYVDGTSSLDSIHITGNNTAKFIGEVYAPTTPVTVDSGATYTMDNAQLFTVQSITNAGTLKIGAGNTGTITGNFTNTGTFSPTITNTQYGKLVVSGTATLGGKLYVDATALTANHSYSSGTISGIITAGAVTGTFASYDTNSLLFNFTPVYQANEVDLTVAAKAPKILQTTTTLGNTPAAGASTVLDRIITADPTGAIATSFQGFTSGQERQLNNAVTQTLPLLTGSSTVAAGSALSSINKVVQARIESNSGLSSGEDFYGDKRFWMKPFGSWADQSDRDGVSGYKARVAGLAFGADGTLSDITRVGLSFAYAKANITGNSSVAPNSANTDVYVLIGYGSHRMDSNTELSWQADVGNNQNRGRRDILFAGTTAKSSYDSLTAHAGIGIGRSYALSGATSFTPSARIDYTRIRDAAYNETGAGALDLNVKSRTTEQLIYSADGKLAQKLDDSTTLAANLGLGYDAKAKATAVIAAYAGAPDLAFTTTGLAPKPWLLRGGLGLVHQTKDGPEITARYDAEHREGFNNQTVSAKFRWAF